MMKKKLWLLCSLLLCRLQTSTAQSGEELRDAFSAYNLEIEAYSGSPDTQVLLAASNREYPVTPGDVYQLTYLTAEGAVSFEIIVSSDFSINLNLFGNIDAAGMNYNTLRSRVQDIILKAYPGSRPQLILQTTGTFLIYIRGDVKNSGYISCWGLSRLLDVLAGRTTPYSSIREVEVLSAGGDSRQYDLFTYIRQGDRSQNPLLKPEDTVILHHIDRQVKLTGEVYRPGTYQLQPEDTLAELIKIYGEGFTKLSDPVAIRIVRYDLEEAEAGRTYYVDGNTTALADFALRDLDEIFVPGKKTHLPHVTFEGAIDGAGSTRVRLYTFVPGETLSNATRQLSAGFTQTSDLKAAYVLRRGQAEAIPVNLKQLLYEYTSPSDLKLNDRDRIIIPFKQYFVSLSGAVITPGHYPYIPDKDYTYYINLAGGIDPAKNSRGGVKIRDKNGEIQPQNRIILPEDSIFVENDSFLYKLERWSPVIELSLSVTALVLGLLQLYSN